MNKRIVVKIGSSMLTDQKGSMSLEKIKLHSEAIAKLAADGHEVILVSSGAVAAGFRHIGYPARPVTTAGKQAAAAVGQGLLMQAYAEAFQAYQLSCAQLLLTRDVFSHASQYDNAYVTLNELLKRKVIPIINENDSISLEELTFGDNDMLSALVSGLIKANLLILITDVNGLYDKNPAAFTDAKRYEKLDILPEELISSIEASSSSNVGTGGMKSKVLAAETAISLGANVFIGTNKHPDDLLKVVHGNGDGTYIGAIPAAVPTKTKQWLALHSKPKGSVIIDQGAVHAIEQEGKSLLPVGVVGVEGMFQLGDVIEIYNETNRLIAKGKTDYSARELQQVKGMDGYTAMQETTKTHPEVVHRDQLVLRKEK